MNNGAAVAAAKAIPYPIHLAGSSELPIIPEHTRFVRTGLWMGILMTKPNTPSGWGWNPASVTFGMVAVVAIFGAIATLMGASYYVGQRDAELRLMNEKMTETKAAAEDAHTKATYAISRVDDGHVAKPEVKKPIKGKKNVPATQAEE